MYYLFRYKNYKLRDMTDMGLYEKICTKVFVEQEIEDKNKEIEEACKTEI